jgi:hypothetical protein
MAMAAAIFALWRLRRRALLRLVKSVAPLLFSSLEEVGTAKQRPVPSR